MPRDAHVVSRTAGGPPRHSIAIASFAALRVCLSTRMPTDLAAATGTPDHAVRLYSAPSDLRSFVSAHLAAALEDDGIAIAAATPAHLVEFEDALEESGVDVVEARRRGRLILVDATAAADRLMQEDGFDAAFDAVVTELIRSTIAPGRRVHVYGEIVAVLWEAGHVVEAIELERRWNQLQTQLAFSLLCAYPAELVGSAEDAAPFQQVCELHTAATDAHGRAIQTTRTERREFPCTIEAPAAVRRFVRETLSGWDRREDAVLAASELAVNAVIHARTPFRVEIERDRARVRISVRDASEDAPRRSPRAGGGYGLPLVTALSDGSGYELEPGGKTVWFELLVGR
jgi:anti-sigma regulatory factor (Ser/Thr protein kinase)